MSTRLSMSTCLVRLRHSSPFFVIAHLANTADITSLYSHTVHVDSAILSLWDTCSMVRT